MSFPVTAQQLQFAAAGGGGAFAKSTVVAVKTKKATRKRKAPRDASTTAREERASAERKRTRRIAQLIAELRSEVVGEIPTSGLDRISVLDNACILIGRLRSRVNALKRAQGMASTAKRSPEGTPDMTPPASPPPYAGGPSLASKALVAGGFPVYPAARAPVRLPPSFASRRDEEDQTKQMLSRLLAENSMLRHRAQQSNAAAAGGGYWSAAAAQSAAAWAASGGAAGAHWPHAQVAASDRILAASAATKLYALSSQIPSALTANPAGVPPSAAALHAAYAAFSGRGAKQ